MNETCETCKQEIGSGPTWCRACTEHRYRASIERTAADGRLLADHTSPDTAYLVEDYPYGFRLRCQIRYWLEHKKNHGFRLVSQTTNPKKPGTVWNKPKAGVYHEFAVMVLDDEGHVSIHVARPGGWTEWATLDAIEQLYASALTDAHRAALRYIRATIKAGEVLTVTVGPADGTPRQTDAEKVDIFRAALGYGYSQLPPA